MEKLEFPKGFLWGAATSAHQVEGNNRNDWTEWEAVNAERLSKENGGKYPPENFISGRACDHYNRFREDFDIAKSLGHNANRFSIEWSRIEPEEGKWDEKEIEHYREVIKALRERGIEPFVTIWHWTLPVWLRDKGGVLSTNFPEYFKKYAKKIASELGSEIQFWITVNEPEIYAMNSYLRGKWPPQRKSLRLYIRVMRNLAEAHRSAYKTIHNDHPEAKVGAATNLSYFEAGSGTANQLLKWLAERYWNYYFLRKTTAYFDFIGLNYYFHNRIYYGFNKNVNKIISDLGWEVYPDGLYHVLKDLAELKKPIYITENGMADAKDLYRADFIKNSLKNIHKAMSENADVRGYLHWSLLDNFEWESGFGPRFGLVEMDYKTLERRIRQSAYEYAKIAKENALEV